MGCSQGVRRHRLGHQVILDPKVDNEQHGDEEVVLRPSNAQYQPKQGRSGGGLYTTDGYVAGVCDFADPNEHVGLYAVPEAIHRLLDNNKLTALYKAPGAGGGDVMLASNRGRAKGPSGTKVRAQNADEGVNPEDVTLPPPSMVGIKNPTTDGKPWTRRTDPGAIARGPRPSSRPEAIPAEEVDRGAQPGEALTAELTGDPGPEARALEDRDEPNPAAKAPFKPSSNPKASGWRPVRQNAGGMRPAAR